MIHRNLFYCIAKALPKTFKGWFKDCEIQSETFRTQNKRLCRSTKVTKHALHGYPMPQLLPLIDHWQTLFNTKYLLEVLFAFLLATLAQRLRSGKSRQSKSNLPW